MAEVVSVCIGGHMTPHIYFERTPRIGIRDSFMKTFFPIALQVENISLLNLTLQMDTIIFHSKHNR